VNRSQLAVEPFMTAVFSDHLPEHETPGAQGKDGQPRSVTESGVFPNSQPSNDKFKED